MWEPSLKPSTAIDLKRAAVREVASRFRASNPRIFGSVLHGTDRDGSDLDLLVDALPGATLFDLGGLHAELEELLGACRTWGVASEKRPQRGQFLPDLQAHSATMGQKAGEKWTAEAVSQPTIPKPDRLLGVPVDLLTPADLPPKFREAVLAEARPV